MQRPQTLKEIRHWIESDRQLSLILSAAQKHDEGDAAHDLSHLFRVALWTMQLGEDAVDPKEAVAAALLHDLVNIPKNHPHRSKASELSAEAALPILKEAGFTDQSCQAITGAIRDHSFSRGAVPESQLGKALQDADRLEALGAIGLMRVFSTGNRMGAAYFHPEDPWALNRPLDDKAFSLDHFFTKLLKLPSSFHTARGRAVAEARAGRMEEFLKQAAEEIGVPRP